MKIVWSDESVWMTKEELCELHYVLAVGLYTKDRREKKGRVYEPEPAHMREAKAYRYWCISVYTGNPVFQVIAKWPTGEMKRKKGIIEKDRLGKEAKLLKSQGFHFKILVLYVIN